MQKATQINTEPTTSIHRDDVQQYLDELVGSIDAQIIRPGAVLVDARSGYDTEMLDLDKKEEHILESDIASTRIYPQEQTAVVSDLKGLLDINDSIRPVCEKSVQHVAAAFVWSLATAYRVFVMLDSVAEKVLRAVVAAWSSLLERINHELMHASEVVAENKFHGTEMPMDHRPVNMIETYEQPRDLRSIDTLVFATQIQNDGNGGAVEQTILADQDSTAGSEHSVNVSTRSISKNDTDGVEVHHEGVTIRGVAKALYLDLRYGPPHLR
jgi:hypothetical protein